MTINELVEKIKTISLEKVKGVKSFYVGNTWDMATGKQDIYPNVWFEMPVLVEYQVAGKLTKQFSFSLDILALPKLDDTVDEINMISHMEEIADEILYWMYKDKDLCNGQPCFSMVNLPTGLTIKSINADYACGIRLDIKINTGRVCPPLC